MSSPSVRLSVPRDHQETENDVATDKDLRFAAEGAFSHPPPYDSGDDDGAEVAADDALVGKRSSFPVVSWTDEDLEGQR